MTAWLRRFQDAPMPYQDWRPFHPEAIVQIENVFGDVRVGPAHTFWWGYEEELCQIGEGVIIRARRLDKPKEVVNG